MTKFVRCASMIFLACFLVACSPTPPKTENSSPSPAPSISNTNGDGGGGTFAITEPKSGSEVDVNVITVKGVGAKTGDSIQVQVLTNQWYLQKGQSDIAPDGSWTYSPCNLGGEGKYRLSHTIKATLIRDGKPIATSSVDKIKAPEPNS